MSAFLKGIYNSIMGVKPVEPPVSDDDFGPESDDGSIGGPDIEYEAPDSEDDQPGGPEGEDDLMTGGGRMVLGNTALVAIIFAMTVFQR